MSNQYHDVLQLGPRQHITDLYRYGYNLSNIYYNGSHPQKNADC